MIIIIIMKYSFIEKPQDVTIASNVTVQHTRDKVGIVFQWENKIQEGCDLLVHYTDMSHSKCKFFDHLYSFRSRPRRPYCFVASRSIGRNPMQARTVTFVTVTVSETVLCTCITRKSSQIE